MHQRTKKGHIADAFEITEKRREREFRARRKHDDDAEARISIFERIRELGQQLAQPATLRMA